MPSAFGDCVPPAPQNGSTASYSPAANAAAPAANTASAAIFFMYMGNPLRTGYRKITIVPPWPMYSVEP